jgi:hypothetical protein
MSLGDTAVVAGMFLAPLALVLTIVAIVRLPSGRARRIHTAVAAACAIVLAAGAVSTGWWWGSGFDEAEANGVASRGTDRAMVASFWVTAAACVGVSLAGTTAAVARRRLIPNR